VNENNRKANEYALKDGLRALAAYTLRTGENILDHNRGRPQHDDDIVAGGILMDGVANKRFL
jgi:hypothetical protein